MKFIGLVAVLITLVSCQTAATNQGNDNSATSKTRSGTTKRSGTQIELKEAQTFNGFSSPTGIALDEEKNIYVTNWSGGTITKITPDGDQSDFRSAVGSPSGIAYLDNHLYVSDYGGNVIYRLTLEGEKEVFARDLRTPAGISISQDGNLLVANRASNEIIKLNSAGEKEVIARDLETPVAALELENGDLYVSNYGGGIIRVSDQVNEDFSRNMARPGVGMVRDSEQNLFFPDNGGDSLRQLFDDGSTAIVYDGIKGAVALLYVDGLFYASSWGDGSISILAVDD